MSKRQASSWVPTGSSALRTSPVPSGWSRPRRPATSTSSRHQCSGRQSSGSIIRIAWIRGTGMVSATVPSSPRRIRTPSGETATVKAYWVETRRQTIPPQMISHQASGAPTASRPPGVTATIAAPTATATTASGMAEISAEPTSLPVPTEATTLSAGSGVAGSRPWCAASSRARSANAAASVR
jgi:hypothetical protein